MLTFTSNRYSLNKNNQFFSKLLTFNPKAKSSPSHQRTRAFLDEFIANVARIEKTQDEAKDGKKGRLLSLDGGGIKGVVSFIHLTLI